MTCRACVASCGGPMLASGASAMPAGLCPGFRPHAPVWRPVAIGAPVSDSCCRQAGVLWGDLAGHRPALMRGAMPAGICPYMRLRSVLWPAFLQIEKRSFVYFRAVACRAKLYFKLYFSALLVGRKNRHKTSIRVSLRFCASFMFHFFARKLCKSYARSRRQVDKRPAQPNPNFRQFCQPSDLFGKFGAIGRALPEISTVSRHPP